MARSKSCSRDRKSRVYHLELSPGLFNGHSPVHAVLIVQVDLVNVKALERVLHSFPDILALAIDTAWDWTLKDITAEY